MRILTLFLVFLVFMRFVVYPDAVAAKATPTYDDCRTVTFADTDERIERLEILVMTLHDPRWSHMNPEQEQDAIHYTPRRFIPVCEAWSEGMD